MTDDERAALLCTMAINNLSNRSDFWRAVRMKQRDWDQVLVLRYIAHAEAHPHLPFAQQLLSEMMRLRILG